MQERQDIEKLLLEGNTICVKPKGYSMSPLFCPGRDEAIVEPVAGKGLQRGDVVLYRRDKNVENGGILVLHRIWKIKQNGFYLVGDNQTVIEGPLRKEQIKGIMVGINRKGKYIPVTALWYRVLVWLWLWLLPLRPVVQKLVSNTATLLKGKRKK